MEENKTNGVDAENNKLQEIKYVSSNASNEYHLDKFTPEKRSRKPDSLFLYFSVVTALLPWFVGGSTLVWASSALIKLKSNDTTINPLGRPITTYETSMLLGAPILSGLVGTSFLPKLADLFGRKISLQLIATGMLLGIVGIALSYRIEAMVSFAAIHMIFYSAVWCIAPIYLMEICEDHNRAKHCCIMTLGIPLGELYSFAIGSLFNIKIFTLLIAMPLVIFLVFSLYIVESPVYSFSQNRKEECKKSLKKLRRYHTSKELEKDLNTIKQSVQNQNGETRVNILNIFATKEGRIGLILALLPVSLQSLCGVPILMPQIAPIFNQSGSTISGNSIAIIVGLLKTITSSITSFVVEKIGRKPLLILSSVGTGTSITILGTFFYLKDDNPLLVVQFSWVPVVAILVCVVSYSVGLGPVPAAILNEFFPSNMRSAASSFAYTIVILTYSCLLISYPLLAETIGDHWCMWLFGIICFVCTCLIYVFLPETKGKDIVEIIQMLKNF